MSGNAPTTPPADKRGKIAPFVKGDSERTALHASAINEIVDASNLLNGLEVVFSRPCGWSAKLEQSDSNIVLAFTRNDSGSSSAGTGRTVRVSVNGVATDLVIKSAVIVP